MADEVFPLFEQITQNIVTSLAEIPNVGGCGEFLIIQRPDRRGNKVQDGLVVIHLDNPIKEEPLSQTAEGRIDWILPYVLEAYVVDSEGSSRPPDQRIVTIWADIYKALLADPFRNGLAIDTVPIAPVWMDDEQGRWQGVLANFDVRCRTMYDDPYTRG